MWNIKSELNTIKSDYLKVWNYNRYQIWSKLVMITIMHIYSKTNFMPFYHEHPCWSGILLIADLCRAIDQYTMVSRLLIYLLNLSLCPSITMVSHLSSNLALWRFVGLHWQTKVVGLRHHLGFLWGSYIL
jgi:hypothetical protein